MKILKKKKTLQKVFNDRKDDVIDRINMLSNIFSKTSNMVKSSDLKNEQEINKIISCLEGRINYTKVICKCLYELRDINNQIKLLNKITKEK